MRRRGKKREPITQAAITFGSRRLISMAQKHKEPRGSLHSSAHDFLSLSFFLSFRTRAMCSVDFLSSRVACQRPTPTHPAVVLRNFSKSHHAPPKCAYKSPFSAISPPDAPEKICGALFHSDNKFTSWIYWQRAADAPGSFTPSAAADSARGLPPTKWEVTQLHCECDGLF